MTAQLLLAILSTSVISSVLGGIVAGAYALHAKSEEYANEYYKIVLSRRIAAYERVEDLIVALKASVVDDDRKPFHLMFSSDDAAAWERGFVMLHAVMSQGLWLSDEIFVKIRDFNYLIFRSNKPTSVIEFAKENYQAIATIRAELERLLARDMLNLHKVKKFLISKNKADQGFLAVSLKK